MTFRDQTGEEHAQELYDTDDDGRGRVDWTAVEKAFKAPLVEIVGRGTPPLWKRGEYEGFTFSRFQAGTVVDVRADRARGKKLSCADLDLLTVTSNSFVRTYSQTNTDCS